MTSGNDEFVPHEDGRPNDENPPHGANTEEEKQEANDGSDDD